MSELNKEVIKRELIKRKKELLEKNKAEVKNELQKDSNNTTGDESDQANDVYMAFSSSALHSKRKSEIAAIDNAIQRIETDADFGVCEECGENIPIKRLVLIPYTTMCRDCQTEEEQKNKLRKHQKTVLDYTNIEEPQNTDDDAEVNEEITTQLVPNILDDEESTEKEVEESEKNN